mmetsp:Transcript_44761/g.136604  ORF Transcript_44761/g.136604 Transcript_44761/m.136604 type:complete len:81 (+) Transcript_44761:138-380(+)
MSRPQQQTSNEPDQALWDAPLSSAFSLFFSCERVILLKIALAVYTPTALIQLLLFGLFVALGQDDWDFKDFKDFNYLMSS